MKFILAILLISLSLNSHAQRYRLVADSSYLYEQDEGRYVVRSTNVYVYVVGSNRGSTLMGDTVYYDTSYGYQRTTSNRTLHRSDGYRVKRYDDSDRVVKYESYYSKGDSTSLLYYEDMAYDAAGNLTVNTRYKRQEVMIKVPEYSKHGRPTEPHVALWMLLPTSKDSFAYNEHNDMTDEYSYNASNCIGMTINGDEYPPYIDSCRLVYRRHKRYEYKRGKCRLLHYDYVQDEAGGDFNADYFRYRYNKQGQLVRATGYKINGKKKPLMTVDDRIVYNGKDYELTQLLHDGRAPVPKLEKQYGVKHDSKGRIVQETQITHDYWGEETKEEYQYSYTNGNKTSKVYMEYKDGVLVNKVVTSYTYNALNYITQWEETSTNYYKGKEQLNKRKIVYTYEAY